MNFADVRRARAEIEYARQNYYRFESTVEETRAKIFDCRNKCAELRFEISDLEKEKVDKLFVHIDFDGLSLILNQPK